MSAFVRGQINKNIHTDLATDAAEDGGADRVRHHLALDSGVLCVCGVRGWCVRVDGWSRVGVREC
jgi:hypothetical protein